MKMSAQKRTGLLLGAALLLMSGDVLAQSRTIYDILKAPANSEQATPDAARIKGLVNRLLQDFSQSLLEYEISAPIPQQKPAFIQSGPLNPRDTALYEQAFTLQSAGHIKPADKALSKVGDLRLRGHVLFQRYMHPDYRSSYEELHNWLVLYADHPGADRIYRLALSRRPQHEERRLNRPESGSFIARHADPTVNLGQTYVRDARRSPAERKAYKAAVRKVSKAAQNENFDAALKAINQAENRNIFDSVEADIQRSSLASKAFYNGHADLAFNLASKAADRSGLHVPKAGWIAGLIAWQKQDYHIAAKYFEIPARSSYATGWVASAGAYWAARSHMRMANVREVSTWLHRAAAHPRSFYGLIATRALGRDFSFNWQVPDFSRDHLATIASFEAGRRAVALVAAGQHHLAEAELLRLPPDNQAMREAFLAYAAYAGLPALALRLGHALSEPDGNLYDAALYPTANLTPPEGFKIDPALIHAIMRQESKFETSARSPMGARGLMQIMPGTADFIAGGDAEGSLSLEDPLVNLNLGQTYLKDLLYMHHVDHDLINLLAAYNAGPGNLRRWIRKYGEVKDPLLFIELIDIAETRAYIERVLANYWIYQLRAGMPTPTLDAIAAGRRPAYQADKAALEVAHN